MISCEECGLIVEIPPLRGGTKARCPRCNHLLCEHPRSPYQTTISLSIATLIMLVLSISFPFMSFSAQGVLQEIALLDAVTMLKVHENAALAVVLLLTVIILPALYLSCVLVLFLLMLGQGLYRQRKNRLKTAHILARLIFFIKPWIMVDVFLIGILVSLIKIAALADISMGSSFWAFCLYALLLVKSISSIDRNWLWSQLFELNKLTTVKPKIELRNISEGVVDCHMCHQLNRVSESQCIRCSSRLRLVEPLITIQKSSALLLTAMVFYIPANMYPIMYTSFLGASEPSTILGGVILLWEHGSYPIAIVIFVASVLIPLAKMIAMSWLLFSIGKKNSHFDSLRKLKLYRVTEFIGRWSMIDVFVVSVLVALVQLKGLMAIYPGPAAFSFAIVVIFTMLSAMAFDSKLLWRDRQHLEHSKIK
ncbi:paraquat-inducible protein A [Vibrio aquimaris]|nr:paraquat-inducible protein A [Vibrio aquimaris]